MPTITDRVEDYLAEHGWMSLHDIRDDLGLTEADVEEVLLQSSRINRGYRHDVGGDVAWLRS